MSEEDTFGQEISEEDISEEDTFQEEISEMDISEEEISDEHIELHVLVNITFLIN